MVTFEEFEKALKPIIEWNNLYEQQSLALKLLYPSSFVVPETGKILDAYIDLLSKYIGDSDGWIDYFCWECDFGKKPQIVTVQHLSFKLITIKNLYDLIMFCKDVAND